MTRKKYLFWKEVLRDIGYIAEDVHNVSKSQDGIDFAHWVAERIRQLGRDLEPPTGPVIHEAKEE